MRNYEDEILELLKSNGNCIDGFNNLQRLGNFHPNTLVKYLKTMKKNGLIEVTEANKQRKKYCIPNNNFEWSGDDFYHISNIMHRDRERKDITKKELTFLTGSIVRLTFQTLCKVEVYLLCEKYVNHNTKHEKEMEQVKKKLWKDLDFCIKFLSADDRLKVLTSLMVKPSRPVGLDEYRKTNPVSE